MDSSKENDIIRRSFGAGTTADYGGSSSILLLLDIAEGGLSKTLGSARGSDTLEDLMASSEIPVCRICPLFGIVITIPILPHHLGGGKHSDRLGSNMTIEHTRTVRHAVAGILGISKSASEISTRSYAVTKEVQEAHWTSLAFESLVQVLHRSGVIIIFRTVNDQRQEQTVDK
jgi:hypothetical protein